MLPSLNQSTSRAARRTWLFLGVAAVLALALPTAHTETRPRDAGAASGLDAPDPSNKGPAALIEQRGEKPADQFMTGEDGVFVEYLPRPTKAETALEEPLDFEVVEMPFEDCVKLFAQRAKINIVLDYQWLADNGVALEQPITMSAKGGRAVSVLNRLLEPLNLAALFEEDYLKITTAALAGDWLILRWYPVWDLYPGSAVPQPNGPPARKPQPGFGGLTEPRGEFDLITAITTTIQPDTWEDLSGPGSLAYVKELKCLAIRQTGSAHRETLKLLRLWREMKRMERAAAAETPAKTAANESKLPRPNNAEAVPDDLNGKQ